MKRFTLNKNNFEDWNYEMFRDYGDCFLVRRENKNGHDGFGYAMFSNGRKEKPLWSYYFRCESDLTFRINETLRDIENKKQQKIELAETKKANMKKVNPKVGDIYYTSWGYDQTNVEFYQVVEVAGKSTVLLRQLCSKMTGNNYNDMSGYKMPVKDKFYSDEVLKRRVTIGSYSGGCEQIKIDSVSYAWKWDGKEVYCSWYA